MLVSCFEAGKSFTRGASKIIFQEQMQFPRTGAASCCRHMDFYIGDLVVVNSAW